jgi:hypothetical protein
MFKSVKKITLVLACFSSISAFAVSENEWLRNIKHTFKHANQPSAESLTDKATWQCVESRTDGSNETRTYQVSKVGTMVYAENVNNSSENFSFVADKKTKSFTASNAHSGVQFFARETGDSEILIEMTTQDATLKTRSAVSCSLKVYGYMSCILG